MKNFVNYDKNNRNQSGSFVGALLIIKKMIYRQLAAVQERRWRPGEQFAAPQKLISPAFAGLRMLHCSTGTANLLVRLLCKETHLHRERIMNKHQ